MAPTTPMADTPWRERILRARECGRFSAEDRVRAARWSTCAVGELVRRRRLALVRLKNGCPVDAALRRFGTSFFAAVLADDVTRAESTLAEIEKRVSDLTPRRTRGKVRVANVVGA
jgi:hypothetical protein